MNKKIAHKERTAYVRVANFGSIKILEKEMQYKEKVYSEKGSFVKKYKIKLAITTSVNMKKTKN